MKVLVNGTVKTLSITDANGTDFTQDFIGNYGAFSDGQFTWNEEANAYIADEDTFEWWSAAIERESANIERIAELTKIYGSEKVNEAIINAAFGGDLENTQYSVADALDELEALGE